MARWLNCGAINRKCKASCRDWATFLQALMRPMAIMARSLNCGISNGKFETGSDWARVRGVKPSMTKAAFLKAVFAHALMAGLFSMSPTASPWAFSHALMAALSNDCLPLRRKLALKPTVPQVPLDMRLTSDAFGAYGALGNLEHLQALLLFLTILGWPRRGCDSREGAALRPPTSATSIIIIITATIVFSKQRHRLDSVVLGQGLQHVVFRP
jgi:hypothetical protein